MNLSEQYRPLQFCDLWQGSEDPTIKLITSELQQNRFTSPALFSAPYGTGKTSVARITGLRTTCERPHLHPYEPCLACEACQSILKQVRVTPTLFNLYGYAEVDCSRISADTVLDLILQEKQFAKIWSRKSVFRERIIVLDEFGRYSEAQQRRFLKMLETRGILLILCCADGDHLDKAIQDRCNMRPFALPLNHSCVEHIINIVEREKGTADIESARLLAQRTGNNPRLILNVLGDALTLGQGNLTLSSVEQALHIWSMKR